MSLRRTASSTPERESTTTAVAGADSSERTPLLSEQVRQAGPSSSSSPLAATTAADSSRRHRSREHRQRRATKPLLPKAIVRGLGVLLALLVIALFAAIVVQEIKDRRDPRFGKGRNYPAVLAHGTHGAVAAESHRCSQIGVDGEQTQPQKCGKHARWKQRLIQVAVDIVLKQNGTAVDAAIAATFCTGVVNMFSSGLGGGGFMTVRVPRKCTEAEKRRDKQKRYCSDKHVIDFRETAPAASHSRMFEGDPMAARIGGLSVGVPGELLGIEEAHRRWGKLSWSSLVEPSIKLAESTYVSRELDRRLKMFGAFMLTDPDWAPTFVNADTGTLLRAGDTIRRPGLANLLRAVASQGSKALYEGPFAKSIVDKVQEKGGILTLEDLASYKIRVLEPVEGTWKNRSIFTTPAPTSGPVLISLLKVLSTYPDWNEPGSYTSGLTAHRFIEAMKFTSGQRTHIGDPAFLNKSALDAIDELASEAAVNHMRSKIDDERTHDEIDYYEPLFDVRDSHGTMHLSTVDESGMAVALTSTVNLIFGSQVLDPVSGVILNDEMDDSSTPGVPNAFGLFPSPFNYPEPGKRPLSSTAPAIIEHADGSFYLAIGGAGGSRIYGSIAQVLLNLDWGYTLSDAIERPRIHHQLLPHQVSAETTTEPSRLDGLTDRGHELEVLDINLAVAEVQAVMCLADGGPLQGRRRRDVWAASDSRKEGVAVAY